MASTPRCIYCGQDSFQAPLISFLIQDQDAWICSEHLPILIHKPHLLKDKLPDIPNLKPAEHEE